MIKAIMAVDENYGVSKNGTLPWPHNEKDYNYFMDQTKGHVIVMGSKTWEDPHMPCPMPDRTNILISNKDTYRDQAFSIVRGDIVKGIQFLAKNFSDKDTWIIGGPNIIEQTIDIIEEFHLSKIPGKFDCDTELNAEMLNTFDFKTRTHDLNVTFIKYSRR